MKKWQLEKVQKGSDVSQGSEVVAVEQETPEVTDAVELSDSTRERNPTLEWIEEMGLLK